MYTHPTYNHFSESDFSGARSACTPDCSLTDMHPETMAKADAARRSSGIPWVITSAYRSVEHDQKKGRSGKGAHPKGRALDIRARNSRERYLIVKAALEVGFTRIGIHEGFVHVDDAPDLPQEVMWLY